MHWQIIHKGGKGKIEEHLVNQRPETGHRVRTCGVTPYILFNTLSLEEHGPANEVIRQYLI